MKMPGLCISDSGVHLQELLLVPDAQAHLLQLRLKLPVFPGHVLLLLQRLVSSLG